MDDTLSGVPVPVNAPVDTGTGKPTIDLTEVVSVASSDGVSRVYVLAAVSDVNVSGAVDGQVLAYNASPRVFATPWQMGIQMILWATAGIEV
ncbi:hypothetical protein ABZV93_28350 [Actinopolymorpha sp. NPDC004070]|uniref:hypothetical protein n=1 Tax=Actinopolymorpha sp. NPDC004070 TaxID=3154548 RepID=UPI0033A85135